jgi:flagellar biogenesis protein FliO
MKLDKILISIALIILLLLILVLGYLFVKSKLVPELNVMEQKNSIEEGKILNLDKEKAIKNP